MRAWWIAASNPVIVGAFEALAEHSAHVTSRHRPICVASGECCQFARHGHDLFVTGLEAALVTRRTGPMEPTRARRAWEQSVCAHLSGRSCAIHALRPLGCRTYFCDPRATHWHAELAESVHQQVRELHDAHALPYLFAEWTWLAEAFSSAHARGLLSEAVEP